MITASYRDRLWRFQWRRGFPEIMPRLPFATLYPGRPAWRETGMIREFDLSPPADENRARTADCVISCRPTQFGDIDIRYVTRRPGDPDGATVHIADFHRSKVYRQPKRPANV